MPIAELKGKPRGKYLLFGLLCQMEDDCLYLEDEQGSIKLQFQSQVSNYH
jgi:hypothetical protein